MNDAEVTFGGLDLLEGGDSPYLALSEGATPGYPTPFITSLRRQLLDGAIVKKDGDGNRLVSFSVLMTCDDPLALAEAEAELVAQVYAPRNELRIKPPGLNTPVSVFETFVGEIRQDLSHDLYDPETRWVFDITLPALPHARSESELTATLTLGRRLVDDGTDASLWTPVGTDTVASVAGKIRLRVVEETSGGGLFTATGQMVHGDRIPLDMGRYLSVVMDDPVGMLSFEAKASATGFPLASAADTVALSGGRTRYYFGPFSAGFVEDFTVQAEAVKGSAHTLPLDFLIDDVYVEASLPATTSRVAYGTVEVEGSVRSPQNLTIENAELGNVMVFVAQPHNGFRPDLSPYHTGSVGGAYTADATLISGGYRTAGVHTYDVPAVTLRPVAYQVVAHVTGGIPGDGYVHTITAQLFAADGTTALTDQTEHVKRTVQTSSDWQFVTLGTVYPPEVSAASTNLFRLEVDPGLTLDEVWLVPMDAELLQVAAGEATRMRVLAPSADYPNAVNVFLGTSDADEVNATGKFIGRIDHFEAGTNLIHVVTTGAVLDPDDVTVSGYPHWHSNAAM